jgi:hypothetical protein
VIARCQPIPDDVLALAQHQDLELIHIPDGRRLYCVGRLADLPHQFTVCFQTFAEARTWLLARAQRRTTGGAA